MRKLTFSFILVFIFVLGFVSSQAYQHFIPQEFKTMVNYHLGLTKDFYKVVPQGEVQKIPQKVEHKVNSQSDNTKKTTNKPFVPSLETIIAIK